ncbi:MAG: hypothetical protein OEZ03_07765 [Alphaproteobacteria bacterium]|nr:hypothetical protein [Alphaproteobacteria bacterium]
MTTQTVVAFPGRDFESWMSWVECELAILGFDVAAHEFDWLGAFRRGLKAEDAAAEAADIFENN